MIKFFVEPEAVIGASIYIEKAEDIRHLTKVLRAKTGDAVIISDGTEWEYETEIAKIDEECVTLRIVDKQKAAHEPRTRVTLYQGIPKASKMETIIQKTVEMGVDTIVPVFMERTVVVDKGQFGKKLSRWQKISDEAVKQCKRSMIPQVREPISFADMLKELCEGGSELVICPYENEEKRTMKACLREFVAARENGVKDKNAAAIAADKEQPPEGTASGDKQTPPRIAVIIGPEGGFSDKEINLLSDIELPQLAETAAVSPNRSSSSSSSCDPSCSDCMSTVNDQNSSTCRSGVQLVTLGKTILRTETAGLAAIAMIMYELEL